MNVYSGSPWQSKKLLPPVIQPMAAVCACALMTQEKIVFGAKGNPGFQGLRNKSRKARQHLVCHERISLNQSVSLVKKVAGY
jgi:hypothetical protein